METKISSNCLYGEVLETGGFTYSPARNELIKTGYACPIANTEYVTERTEFDANTIALYRMHSAVQISKNQDLAIGCWWNPRDQKFYMDVVEIEQSLTLALRKGILAEQQSIYDLNKGLTIWLPSPQKSEQRHKKKCTCSKKLRS